MGQSRTPRATASRLAEERPRGDPWHAVGSLTAGVGLYGLLGWGLDRLLDTSWLVAVGIVLGALLGLYSVWKRFMSPLPVDHRDPLVRLTPHGIPIKNHPTETRQEDR